MRKVVITGPPLSGKSSVIKELETLDYNVVHESAREIIDLLRGLKFKEPHKEKRHLFQREVVKLQIRKEDGVSHFPLIFFDRGIVDSIAYYRLDDLELPTSLVGLVNARRYDKVFYLKPLSNIGEDRGPIDETERMRLEILTLQAYKDFGYSPIEVPEMSLRKRVDLILENI